MHEDYLLTKLNDRKITAFYSSEFYGEHVSKSLNAIDRRLERSDNNISGTLIRNNPFKNRKLLSPIVYKDLVVNVVFLGAPSTGKTTIAESLARFYKTKWMPEYGREYWEKHHIDRRLTKKQLLEIAELHIEKEDELLNDSNKYLFCDTNAITTFMFGKYYHESVLSELEQLAIKAEKRYDIYFLCDTDIPYDDTWDRSGDMNRLWFQYEIESDLKIRKIPYIKLPGSLDDRINKVTSILSQYEKFDSIGNLF